jgi:hypothetical protein
MVKYIVENKYGILSASFTNSQFNIACNYADLHNGIVKDAATGKVLKSYCKSKHYGGDDDNNRKSNI